MSIYESVLCKLLPRRNEVCTTVVANTTAGLNSVQARVSLLNGTPTYTYTTGRGTAMYTVLSFFKTG
jgi:hypothetical protein